MDFRRMLTKLAGQAFGGARDFYEVFGYPREVGVHEFVGEYLRGDIAARIIDAYPDATWKKPPLLEGSDAFVKAWEEMDNRLHVVRTLHRLDRLMNMGHYGVLHIGVDGGVDQSQPRASERSSHRILYMQPHSERTAQITAWESDPTSPRYGLPKLYQLTAGTNWTGAGTGQRTLNVHADWVLHVAERSLEDVSIGTPRLERVFNRLLDLQKLLGGSAEVYWQNAAMIMAFMADKDTQWEPEEASAMKEQLEEMQHGMRRHLRLRGVTAENLAPGLQGSTPADHIDKQIDVLAGALGIPKRILVGSEAGELASSQDENNWAARITERREQFAEPSVLYPFIAKLQSLSALPDGFESVAWEESDNLSPLERADVLLKRAQAVATYTNAPGAEFVWSQEEFRQDLGYDESIVLDGEELLEEDL